MIAQCVPLLLETQWERVSFYLSISQRVWGKREGSAETRRPPAGAPQTRSSSRGQLTRKKDVLPEFHLQKEKGRKKPIMSFLPWIYQAIKYESSCIYHTNPLGYLRKMVLVHSSTSLKKLLCSFEISGVLFLSWKLYKVKRNENLSFSFLRTISKFTFILPLELNEKLTKKKEGVFYSFQWLFAQREGACSYGRIFKKRIRSYITEESYLRSVDLL